MQLETERLAFDSLRNLGKLLNLLNRTGPCDYAESKRERNKSEAGAANAGQAQAVKGLGGQGKELSLDSKSSGQSLIHRVQNGLDTGKKSVRCMN